MNTREKNILEQDFKLAQKLPSGTIVNGKYKVLRCIGGGGFSYVYLVADEETERIWAMKQNTRHLDEKKNATVEKNVKIERETLTALYHRSIPKFKDVFTGDDGTVYIIMDFVSGRTLSKIISDKNEPDIPDEMIDDYAVQICDFLTYLHTRRPCLIYRDMKTDNLIISENNVVKLVDFGAIRRKNENTPEYKIGTHGYAAPELEDSDRNVHTDERTDIYAVGPVIWSMLTRKNPRDAFTPDWTDDVPPEYEYIIRKCTEEDPNDRFQTAEELKEAIEHKEEYSSEYQNNIKKGRKQCRTLLNMAIISVGLSLVTLLAAIYTRTLNPATVTGLINCTIFIVLIALGTGFVISAFSVYKIKKLKYASEHEHDLTIKRKPANTIKETIKEEPAADTAEFEQVKNDFLNESTSGFSDISDHADTSDSYDSTLLIVNQQKVDSIMDENERSDGTVVFNSEELSKVSDEAKRFVVEDSIVFHSVEAEKD